MEDEKNFAVAFHDRLVGRLKTLRFEAPFGGPVTGNLNVVKVDFFADDFVAGHLRGDVVDELADGSAAGERRHAGEEADTVLRPHGDDGGIVHAQMRVDEFFVEGEDFGFGIGQRTGSLRRGVKEKEKNQGQEGRTTRGEHERTS